MKQLVMMQILAIIINSNLSIIRLKCETVAVPSKYLSNYWNFLEISLINCKSELKLRLTKNQVLAVAGVENTYADSNNSIFNIKVTK